MFPCFSRRDALLDINGMPMIIAGMYSSSINTEQDLLVPNMEAPHGKPAHGVFVCVCVCVGVGGCGCDVCACVCCQLAFGAGFNVILPYLHTGTFNLTSLVSYMDR